ncbi:19648_t:CDS:2 [Dentiscutata erythropus]|uniref:19648_t:CDS:1 n=1 Tax=Dentiscutata erythropus TaxID=1348616 RepID=A0A9N9IH60_9GLOM|nr:19648_t:CDS:2 [Dentiscutata erythropus]
MPLNQIVNAVCEKQGVYGRRDLWAKAKQKNFRSWTFYEICQSCARVQNWSLSKFLHRKKDVQLDDGGRMIEKFSITTSIWDIILHFEKTSVYGKSRFYQQPYWTISLLKSTTLQSAGITSGNTVLRLLFRQNELTLDEVVKDIEASLPKELTDTAFTFDKQQKEPINTMNYYDEQQKKPIDTMNNPDEQPKESIDTTMNDPDEQPKKLIDTMMNNRRSQLILLWMILMNNRKNNLTAAELQYLQMEENAGFKTNVMRAQEEKERERKYPKVIIVLFN